MYRITIYIANENNLHSIDINTTIEKRNDIISLLDMFLSVKIPVTTSEIKKNLNRLLNRQIIFSKEKNSICFKHFSSDLNLLINYNTKKLYEINNLNSINL